MEPDPEAESVMDPLALRRRVLLTGVVSLVLFFVLAYFVAAAGASDLWLLVAMGLAYLVVVRPMMRPVRAASSLRRRLAYQAFLDGREHDQREES